jgi:integrase
MPRPETEAGKRDVVIPPFLLKDVSSHLDTCTAAGPRALVFTGPKGAQLRRSNFTRAWNKAAAVAGLTGFHFHHLRHTGNTLAGEEGATLRELMDRMGHASTRAALIYQHRTTHRDRMIADAISKRVKAELNPSGTQRARRKGRRSK